MPKESEPSFLQGGGETGDLIRAHDWASTPLGPPDSWPHALRTAVGLLLGAKQAVYIAWGPELISLYNDGYIPILGTKHPIGLGKPFSVLWAEIWETFRPIVEATMQGKAQHFVDLPIALAGRHNLPVGYFTFSYTALRDDNGQPNGFYCAATETTEQVLTSRRLAETASRLEMALSAGRGIGTWDWDVVADRVVADERFANLYGVDPERAREGAPIAEFFAGIHPADQARLRERIAEALASGNIFSEEYRIVRANGEECWVLSEGRCELGEDRKPRRFPGVTFDITDRKEIEQRIRHLMREVNHRVKNQYSVILAMIRETNKRAESPEEFERQIRERIMALSGSHDLLVQGDWRGSSVEALLDAQLAPFGADERSRCTAPAALVAKCDTASRDCVPRAGDQLGQVWRAWQSRRLSSCGMVYCRGPRNWRSLSSLLGRNWRQWIAKNVGQGIWVRRARARGTTIARRDSQGRVPSSRVSMDVGGTTRQYQSHGRIH